MTTTRAWHLIRRPEGEPADDDFALVESELPTLGDGDVLVQNTFLSVDPYMRGRMNDAPSYVPPFELGQPMTGEAVGVVVEVVGEPADRTGTAISVGDRVVHDRGWRTSAMLPGRSTWVLDTSAAPEQAYLGVLGMPGRTAYVGLLRIAEFSEGDAVFVSAAAGAVGSLVGQIARLKGASRVIGSAGGPEKCRWLTDDLGFDAAVDYRATPIRRGLREAAPDGIDVYFDNVGGDHLEAALSAMRPHGRVAVCGMISVYNSTEPSPAPRNLATVIGKRLTLRGFIQFDHDDLRPQFEEEVGRWLREGRITWRETSVEGIENAVQGFRDLMSGANIGKMLIRL